MVVWLWENGIGGGLKMATAKDSLRSKVDRLSEEEAQEILGLIAAKGAAGTGATLTREVVRERLAGRAAFRVPPANAAPFQKRKRIQCPGVPASEMLIADRR
jgi:adenylosuccinate lyase